MTTRIVPFTDGMKVGLGSTDPCDFSSFSTYVLVRGTVANATETRDAPVFTSDALNLLVSDNRERFRQRFGDTFSAGVLRGGEFFGEPLVSGNLSTGITNTTSSNESEGVAWD